MGYSAADERFTHQLPRTFDEVHDPDGSWSDRCYFYAHSPDGELLVTSGYGNNPNQRLGNAYGKVALADGRHWDLLGGRKVGGGDRDELFAGPMRWTCVEPLRHWRLDLGPNGSGIEWELHYTPRAPMWELLPMHVAVGERTIVDMYHMKESGTWTGWVQVDGRRTSVDGFPGGRDRTFGVRAADQIAFWLWLDIGFDDVSIQAWVIEAGDGTVQYVDGGFTHTDGTLSKRLVAIEHDIRFDGEHKRPAAATLTFTDEDGRTFRLEGSAPHQHVNAYYGLPLPTLAMESLGDGEYFGSFPWSSAERDQLVALEAGSVSVDQLMRFELDGQVGHGIFEILCGAEGYQRYLANWPRMDMTPFDQSSRSVRDDR